MHGNRKLTGRSRLTLAALLLAFAAAAAWGMAMGEDDAAAAASEMKSKIKLVLDRDGSHEAMVLDDLHSLAVGESRSFTRESGKPVTVTRDEAGFTVEVDGKTLRLEDHFSAAPGEGDVVVRQHKIELRDADGEGNTMVFHSGEGGEEGHVKIVRRLDGDGSSFAWTSGDGAAVALPLSLDATIERLRATAKFQALDAATQEQVIQALRESAPKPMVVVGEGEPGKKVIVLEVEEHAGEDEQP